MFFLAFAREPIGIIDRLEKAEYVRRANDPKDRRRTIVEPDDQAVPLKIAARLIFVHTLPIQKNFPSSLFFSILFFAFQVCIKRN